MAEPCLDYDEVTSDELGERAAREMTYRLEPEEEPDDIVFSGPCPRCEGPMTYPWPLMVVRQAPTELRHSMAVEHLDVTVICRCPRHHAGAGRERGCGAYWKLRVPSP